MFSKPFEANTFDNLPPSQAIPNTYLMKLPKKHLFHSFSTTSAFENFRSLFLKIERALKTHSKGALLVIDNLNMLVNSCERSGSLEFLEVLNDLFSLEGAALALGVNRDLILSEEEIYREVKHSQFDIVMEVSRNLSGYTKDVHGQLNLIANRVN